MSLAHPPGESMLTPRETDQLLRYPRGRSVRLAREKKLPAIILPDGEVRFDAEHIEGLLVVGDLGRVPHLRAEKQLLFHVDTVERVLSERAQQVPEASEK